jgi:hypothetical protein
MPLDLAAVRVSMPHAESTLQAAVVAEDIATPPSRRTRIVAALCLGLIVAGYVFAREYEYPQWGADIVQSWAGSWTLIRGENPYTAIGPNGTFMHWPWPLFYPLPALILTLPFTVLPIEVFRPVFLGGSSAWLAYVLTRRDLWRLAVLASAAFLGSIAAGAWEPLLVAAALTPGACAAYLAKPNVGLALASGLPRRRATYVGIGIAALLCVASLFVRPGWIPEWREALRAGVHLAGPITRPGGFIVLAALAKWRRADARLLVIMASVPQSMILQAALPLFLVARSRTETILLAMLSFIPYAVQLHYAQLNTLFPELTQHTGTVMVPCLYLPCLIMVLRRPNQWTTIDDI